MKKIEAVIRANEMDDLHETLYQPGVPGYLGEKVVSTIILFAETGEVGDKRSSFHQSMNP
ncbi:MAG: hypothetical protein WAO19_05895 [Candidatus Kryptoniota bacterium]